MTGFLENAAQPFLFVAFIAICIWAGVLFWGVKVYAEGIREVLEERKHQRQIELLEITFKLEELHHGSVNRTTGTDRDRVNSGTTPGEAGEPSHEENDGTIRQPIAAMVTEQPLHGA